MDDLITEILEREGWDTFTDHPADRGGPTKWGITQKSYARYLGLPESRVDVKKIDEQEARDFYMELYIIGPRFHNIINVNLRELVIDCGVNHGTTRASRWLQAAAEVQIDGVIGPVTLEAVNMIPPMELWLHVLATRIQFYGQLVTNKPSQAVFAHGWNNRAAGFLTTAAERVAAGMAAV